MLEAGPGVRSGRAWPRGSLEECLLIQARHIGADDDVVVGIITKHLANLEKKNYPAIAKDLDQPVEEIYEAAKVLKSFDPKPGRAVHGRGADLHHARRLHPQGRATSTSSSPTTTACPKLKISDFYRTALAGGAKAREYIQEKLRSAQWLIRSIQQRQRTIVRVTESILKFQREFFDKGTAHLKPLILRDVAEDIGMHESTVSRVTTNKYVHTPQGIYELKYFFNSGIARTDGEDLASEAVKLKIKQIIGSESPQNPALGSADRRAAARTRTSKSRAGRWPSTVSNFASFPRRNAGKSFSAGSRALLLSLDGKRVKARRGGSPD